MVIYFLRLMVNLLVFIWFRNGLISIIRNYCLFYYIYIVGGGVCYYDFVGGVGGYGCMCKVI